MFNFPKILIVVLLFMSANIYSFFKTNIRTHSFFMYWTDFKIKLPNFMALFIGGENRGGECF